eukprot:7773450-Prorocentrum_lima.AAC.1
MGCCPPPGLGRNTSMAGKAAAENKNRSVPQLGSPSGKLLDLFRGGQAQLLKGNNVSGPFVSD